MTEKEIDKTQLLTAMSPESAKEQINRNQRLLFFTMISFLAFVVAEIIGAIASNSLSLLGDAAAMFIDVVTVIYVVYFYYIVYRFKT